MEDVIRDTTDKIIYLSPAKFREKIIKDGDCFVCGASRRKVLFNNEHIFPKWMLDDFKMHQAKITLSL